MKMRGECSPQIVAICATTDDPMVMISSQPKRRQPFGNCKLTP